MTLMRAGRVVTRLTRALAVLLASPRSTGEWSEHSVEALRKLVRARKAALLLSTESEERVFGDEAAGAALRQLPADRARPPLGATPGATASTALPMAPASVAVHASGSVRVEAVGVLGSLDDRRGVVGAYFTFARPISDRAARARLALLNAVRPALEAAARERIGRRKDLDAVRRTLHAFESGAALFTADGTLVDANNAAASLLAAECGDGPVHRAMVRVVLTARVAKGGDEPIIVKTEAGCFRLRASPIGSLSSGAATDVLVVVEPVAGLSAVPPLVPDVELLRERFRLTEREQEVARLLCLGQSNVAIAETLGISPNTARHHTERVLMKLNIRSRAAIHRVLLETQREMGRTPAIADQREGSRGVSLQHGGGRGRSREIDAPLGSEPSLVPRAD